MNKKGSLEKLPEQFAKYGVTITPAVVVDGKVVLAGKIPTKEEVKTLLSG